MEKTKKIIRRSIILTLILSIFTSLSLTAYGYSDTAGSWYEETINYATKHGIVNGYEDNTFRAENNVSKGEIIKLVVARYADEVTSADYPEHWAMNYVRFAEQNNIIPTGMYNESNLDQPASRKEICYMLIQACRNIAYKPVLDDTGMVLDFEDLNEENKESINENGIDYAQAMRLCYAMGIIKGYPNEELYSITLNNGEEGYGIRIIPKLVKPNENVTRAEASTMVARTYFAKLREYTFVERKGDELPSNASDYVRPYTYMPKSFYEDGKDSFFKYLPNGTSKDFFKEYALDDGTGKSKIEGAYDVLYNISYKMTDEQWNLWKEEIKVFTNIEDELKYDEIDLDGYIQFIKDNKIVIRGGYIADTLTTGDVYSNILKEHDSLTLIKGIGTLYIENPNNVDDISIKQFEWHHLKEYINKSFKQDYVFFNIGLLPVITTQYIQYMDIYNSFYFSNN